jgi:hypothetical protein
MKQQSFYAACVAALSTAILFSLVFISACKRKPKEPAPVDCGPNRTYINGACTCDASSVMIDSNCVSVGVVLSNYIRTAPNITKVLYSTCSDYRSRLYCPFYKINKDYDQIYLVGYSDKGNFGEMPFTFNTIKEGVYYDSVKTHFAEMMYHGTEPDDTVSVSMVMTKSRDSMWVSISKVDMTPFYKILDTCNILMTKIR